MATQCNTNQLDQLLLKAESYSHFILENQKRTQALQRSRAESAQQKSTTKTVKENENTDGVQQPPNLVGGKLMDYQIEGLQWLLSLWENGLNGILADEMGLGKTIQIISLIAHLRHNNTAGPYLIAGPLATISNWVREFKKWLPSCPVLLYHGSKEEREALRKKHMPVDRSKELKFPIVVTSFEMCIVDRPHLEKYVWQYIILDEGHRIKNRNCRLIRELKSLRSVSRLLLTGTPIQNSLDELWSLLNFCSPMIFDDLEVFQSWFDFRNIGHETSVEDILSTEQQDRIVSKMHEILRPFVLRRLKKEVLGDRLPPKLEIVIYCGMTAVQSEFYAQVLSGTIRESLVEVGVEGAKRISQINTLMNLRKVCNHPFLFGDLCNTETGLSDVAAGKMLISSSGKFKLLDRMLPRLKREGSKVLIFSQMTKLLDLLEDYLHLQEHSFVRFDGSTKLVERQHCIDEFNRKDSGVFVFLLSTRAGGLGINLTSADTVILFDSDWNPHQDSQAQDRCHRIGQSKQVVTYRLLTSGSVEIDMMRKQMSKKKLERLTMQGGDYRKAGRREGRQQVGLHELRALLEDDVKNLSKREGGSSSVEWVQQDITDAELDLVMSRQNLFPADTSSQRSSPALLTSGPSCVSLSSAGEGEVTTAKSPISSAQKTAVRGGGRKRKTAAVEEEEDVVVLDYGEYNQAVGAVAGVDTITTVSSSSPTVSDPTALSESNMLGVVPLEGDMYDIVADSSSLEYGDQLLQLN